LRFLPPIKPTVPSSLFLERARSGMEEIFIYTFMDVPYVQRVDNVSEKESSSTGLRVSDMDEWTSCELTVAGCFS
jgi:hypothetical protein